MKTALFIVLTSSLFFTSCEKYKKLNEYPFGYNYIVGKLYLYDTVLGSPDLKTLSKKIVKLKSPNSPDDDFYLSATSDSTGFFKFENLNFKDRTLVVFYQESINGLMYRADSLIDASTNSLPLIARPQLNKSTGFRIIVKDSLNIPLKNIDVCVFTSRIVAASDSCAVSDAQLKTDGNGRASLFGINAGTYYILVRSTLPGLNVKRRDTLVVNTNSVVFRNVVL